MNKQGFKTTTETYVSDLTKLYASQAYFLSLPVRTPRNDYHQIATNPDGEIRNSPLERERWMMNNQVTIRFVKESSCLHSGAKSWILVVGQDFCCPL